MKTQAYINGLRAQWDVLADKNKEIKRQEKEIIAKIKAAVEENVQERFAGLKDGDKVIVTYKGPWENLTQTLYFHKPTVIGTLTGTYDCDYEIRFRGVNKDGSESKRDDLIDNHIPVYKIITIVKL